MKIYSNKKENQLTLFGFSNLTCVLFEKENELKVHKVMHQNICLELRTSLRVVSFVLATHV